MKLWSLSASSPLTSTYWFGTKVTSLVEKSVTPKFSLITASALAKSFGVEVCEVIGPIQMGLNKPIHFTDFDSSVRDIVNITAVAVIDAYVNKIKNTRK